MENQEALNKLYMWESAELDYRKLKNSSPTGKINKAAFAKKWGIGDSTLRKRIENHGWNQPIKLISGEEKENLDLACYDEGKYNSKIHPDFCYKMIVSYESENECYRRIGVTRKTWKSWTTPGNDLFKQDLFDRLTEAYEDRENDLDKSLQEKSTSKVIELREYGIKNGKDVDAKKEVYVGAETNAIKELSNKNKAKLGKYQDPEEISKDTEMTESNFSKVKDRLKKMVKKDG